MGFETPQDYKNKLKLQYCTDDNIENVIKSRPYSVSIRNLNSKENYNDLKNKPLSALTKSSVISTYATSANNDIREPKAHMNINEK